MLLYIGIFVIGYVTARFYTPADLVADLQRFLNWLWGLVFK
jgi:hypothetical protein